uniref:Ig-like domain-containing protein n=1 Tax=Esox lucius TaxID=8010 RepID=A0AAY5KP31_ESOLU
MIITVLLLCLTGLFLCVEVHQTPSAVISRPGENVQLFCHHQKTDYTFMLWYQKSPGKTALNLIGYLNYKTSENEKPYDKRFKISGDLSGEQAKNASLNISNFTPEDTAVYFCAASYAQCFNTPSLLYKNLSFTLSRSYSTNTSITAASRSGCDSEPK